MSEPPEKPKKKHKPYKQHKLELTEKDYEVLAVAAENPGMSNNAIGKKVYGNKPYIHQRLKTSELLTEALEAVKANNLEHMTRVVGPLAIRKLAAMLRDPKQKPGLKARLIDTALKHTPEFKELEQPAAVPMIPIKEMQIHIQNVLIKADGDG